MGAVGHAGGVDDDVVVVREGIERAGGEVAEGRDHEPFGRNRFAVDAADSPVLEPADRPIVPGLYRTEHRFACRRVPEQGEDTERLLGREREVVGDANRGRPPSFQKVSQMIAGDQPSPLGAAMGDEERPTRVTASRK